MTVLRLTIAPHPMLATLAAFLGMLPLPSPPYAQVGDWKRDVDAGVPTVDRPRPLAFRREPLIARPAIRTLVGLLRARLPEGVTISALNYYPSGGSGLGWHTDSVNPGWRIYIGEPLAGVPGVFHTAKEKIADVPGVALAFKIAPILPLRGASSPTPGEASFLSWHAVEAAGPRVSIGIRIRNADVARGLGLS